MLVLILNILRNYSDLAIIPLPVPFSNHMSCAYAYLVYIWHIWHIWYLWFCNSLKWRTFTKVQDFHFSSFHIPLSSIIPIADKAPRHHESTPYWWYYAWCVRILFLDPIREEEGEGANCFWSKLGIFFSIRLRVSEALNFSTRNKRAMAL